MPYIGPLELPIIIVLTLLIWGVVRLVRRP
jgi:hypothetical protein